MHGAPEFQVAAEAYRVPLEAALQGAYRKHVGERLRGVEVAAVARVDDRAGGVAACEERGALLGVPHGDDVHVGAYGADGVGKRFPLGGGAVRRVAKALHGAA